MAGVPEENLEWTGAHWDVAFAEWSGIDQAIDDWNRLDERVRTKFEVRFQALCENRSLPVPYQMRPLNEGIWEFKIKRPAWRITAFQEGRTWLLTHIFKKPGKRRLRDEITKAKRAREEHLRRRRNR